MSASSARRSASFFTTVPENSSSTSIVTSSTGSSGLPPPSAGRMTTRGRPTQSSKPSRRMVSIRMASCSSPRPATSNASVSAPDWVTCERHIALRLAHQPLADHPALHLVAFAAGQRAVIDAEPSWQGSAGRSGAPAIGSVTSGAAIVSATVAFVSPASATMSPASPSSIGWRSRPRKASTLETRPLLDRLAVARQRLHGHGSA